MNDNCNTSDSVDNTSDSVESWKEFFRAAGIPASDADNYADLFVKNRIRKSTLDELNIEYLRAVGISILGDILLILRHCKKICKEARETDGTSTAYPIGENFEWVNLIKEFEPDSKSLRADLYVKWANSTTLRIMFDQFINYVKKFFESNMLYLPVDGSIMEDVINSFFSQKHCKPIEIIEIQNISSELVIINDYCISQPIIISPNILLKINRSVATSKVDEIGYQHLYMHNMIDTSSDDSDEPLSKQLKTCQLALSTDCGNRLYPHRMNSSKLMYTETGLEILIFCATNSINICKNLASHLGIIFVEEILDKVQLNAKKKEVKQIKTANKKANLFKLFQCYVNKCLIFGCNNIGITCNSNIFTNYDANTKCLIYLDEKDVSYKILEPYANVCIKIKNNDLLDYIAAVTDLVNHTMRCDASIDAVYYKTVDHVKMFYSVKFPIIGIIPMYIVNFFALKKIFDPSVPKIRVYE